MFRNPRGSKSEIKRSRKRLITERVVMNLRERFLNMLGAGQGVSKQENAVFKPARDFLRYGNRDKLYPSWSDIKMSDTDMYRGYSYAVIQKRGNKVASLAKANLKTWANPEIVDEYQKKQLEVIHPYLSLIEDSSDFTEKQFWKNISIYLDLAGKYYLGVIRNEIRPLNPKLPIITTDPVKFVMLNPYEIRRVVDKDKNVAGYIERKKDGRYREWPKHQIIEMRELDPFNPDNGQWAMTDAAKNAVYTINQSGDYTRQSLNGNIDAPGIITTDVLLSDEDFANFRARITQHTKGEPLFGNGTGAINWDSMQIDLDKAALLDINEINRTELFAVSGTSKTSLGIEQSGTTRETARVQSEQFVSDTAQPRLEDIVDFLNLDYKKHYANEYQKTGYKIEVESSVAKDYETEQKATELKQSQFQLAMTLVQSGYTTESAYQFAEGKIDFEDLELEKGLDKPKSQEGGEEEGAEENGSNSPNNGPRSGSGGGDGSSSASENNSLQIADNDGQDKDVLTTDLNDITPHSELMENGGGNPNHDPETGRFTTGSGGSSVKAGKVSHKSYSSDGKNVVAEWDEVEHPVYPDDTIIMSKDQIGMVGDARSEYGISKKAYDVRDKRLKNPFDVYEPIDKAEETLVRDYIKKSFGIDDSELDKKLGKTKNSVEGEDSHPLTCTCEHDHKVETLVNELQDDHGKVVKEAYDDFLAEIREVEKETVDACARKVNVNAFDESDIIGKRKKLSLIAKLKNALHKYWWAIFPLLASNSMEQRNKEFGQNETFVFTNDLQNGVDDNAERVSEGHITTILGDILEASNKAYTSVLEDAAAELIVKVYDDSPTKWEQYFDHKPTKADALDSIRRTDILEKNRKIYERANTMAFEGYNRRDIIKAIRNEYEGMSKKRAELIARNETARAYGKSQFEADRQFLNGIGKIDQAYKVWKSRRPANEREKICPFCRHLIETSNANPIPFEKPFVEYGDSLEVVEDGKVKIFTANYEDIQGNSLHPSCLCFYELVFKNAQGEFVKTLNGLELNGGPGSGNFGHAGRPGLVGGSSKESLASSEMRTRRYMLGDTVKITSKGKEYVGVLSAVSSERTSEIEIELSEGKTFKMKVQTATLVQDNGEQVIVPFYNVKMVKNVDTVSTTPAERRTEKQKQALDEMSKMIKISENELNYLRRNCSEESAIALRDELKRAVEDGIDLSQVQFYHNNRLTRTQGKVVYRPYTPGSKLPPLELQMSGKWIADGEYYKNKQQENYEKGWHTSSEIAGILRHELGHIKSAQLVLRNFDKSFERDGKRVLTSAEVSYRNERLCEQIVRSAQANKSYSIYNLSHGSGKDASDYAVKDGKYSELVAESYSNSDFSQVTKNIANQLDKEFKKQNNSIMIKIENELNLDGWEDSLCTGYPMSEEDWRVLHGKKPKEYIPDDIKTK